VIIVVNSFHVTARLTTTLMRAVLSAFVSTPSRSLTTRNGAVDGPVKANAAARATTRQFDPRPDLMNAPQWASASFFGCVDVMCGTPTLLGEFDETRCRTG
jgi:hypothetical protein